MTTVEIISDIEHLPESEQAKTVEYTRRLSDRWKASSAQLGKMAARLPETKDPAAALRLREEIEKGFYGTPSDA